MRTKRATAPARERESEREREAKQRSRKARRDCACVADWSCKVVHESKSSGGAWGNFGEEQEDRYERGPRLGRCSERHPTSTTGSASASSNIMGATPTGIPSTSSDAIIIQVCMCLCRFFAANFASGALCLPSVREFSSFVASENRLRGVGR